METTIISKELDIAINAFENLLNEHDSEFVLEAIKKYKQNKTLDFYTLQELKHRMSR